jgi:hypothetical protein
MPHRSDPRVPSLVLWAAFLTLAGPAEATRFSWEGRLDDGGRPANGRYDLRVTAFAHELHGASLSMPATLDGVEVRDGRFRVEFDLPQVASDQVWLEVGVRASGEAAFAVIPGRAKALATPLIGQCWSTTGDVGSSAALHFIGTRDPQPFVIRTYDTRSVRIEPSEVLFAARPITTNWISGSWANAVTAGVRGAVIAGGGVPAGDSDPEFSGEAPNRVTDHYGVVGGGFANTAGDEDAGPGNAPFATVSGGWGNKAAGRGASVAGGLDNQAGGLFGSVGGGAGNRALGQWSTVAGGYMNLAATYYSTVGGGQANTASGIYSTVAGGGWLNLASGPYSSVGGGVRNAAIGNSSTVAGGAFNCAGGFGSWAGGRFAKVRPATDPGGDGPCSGLTYPGGEGDRGTFVWSDSQDGNFVSTGSNQFLIRAAGGVGIGTNAPNSQLHVASPSGDNGLRVQIGGTTRLLVHANGGVSVGANITPPDEGLRVNGVIRVQTLGAAGSQALCRNGSAEIASCSSSARYKDAIADLDLGLDAVLALRPVGYRWKDGGAADLGFVAEEVAALDERLVTRNAAGEVEGVRYERLAAVLANALQELVARHDAERERRDADDRRLAARLARIEAAVVAGIVEER